MKNVYNKMPKYPQNATWKQIAGLDKQYIKECAIAIREIRGQYQENSTQ